MPMAGCHKSRGKYIVTGEEAIITIFQTEDGGMYVTLEISVADMSGTLTLTLIPVE